MRDYKKFNFNFLLKVGDIVNNLEYSVNQKNLCFKTQLFEIFQFVVFKVLYPSSLLRLVPNQV